jgi:hypothetical protein
MAIACIEDPAVIEEIIAHLQGKDTPVSTSLLPASACATGCPVRLIPSNPSPHSNGNAPKVSARIPVGLMPRVAAQVVRAKPNG